MPCEDYPCCGHEPGGCPVIDENGEQRFPCARCGVLMEPQARSAVCQPCHRRFLAFDDDDAHPRFDDEPSDDGAGWDLGKEEGF